MTLIAQVEDRGAAVAWSPISSHADVVALGSKDSGGIGFEDHGGDLDLYDLKITSSGEGNPKPQALGSVKTTSRFASIGWTPLQGDVANRFRMGLLAGGMTDGSVLVWDPAVISSGGGNQESSSQIVSISKHSGGPVTALQFNPHPGSSHELASGGSDGDVLITSLENPDQPNVLPASENQSKQGGEITRVAWNTQVSHIVASSAGDGMVVVYDTRQKKPWCEIRCEGTSGIAVSDVAWNPTEGLHIITASADDRNPLMKLWDLRASTTMPLASLQGHTQGILSVAWCPHDSSLLVSCGKDNRTLLWDLFSLQPIYEIPNKEPTESASPASMYAGGLSSSQQKRYDVQWSPLRRGVVSTCSFDRKVQVHSLIGAATKSGRTPKWLKRPCGVSCGFGGSIVSFAATHRVATIDTIVEQPILKQVSNHFEQSIASRDFIGFCGAKASEAASAGDSAEQTIWSFMQIIFEANAREQLLQYLGFDPVQINEKAMEFNDTSSNSEINGIDSLSLEDKSNYVPVMSKKAENIVKQALLVGNFEAAVECCFRNGHLADGLVLSSCGGADLWAKTQATYFELESKKRPYLSLVSAVIHNKLEDLVASSDPSKWQETLAILSTYGKADEFPSLCLALGDRLEAAGDAHNASLCYMCALNLDRAVQHWKSQLEEATQKSGAKDTLALHAFVERVEVFLNALDPNTPLDPGVAALFAEYAKTLSEQGLLVTAAKYCRADTQESNELRERLFNSRFSQFCRNFMTSTPLFPFAPVNVGVARAGSTTVSYSDSHTRQQQQIDQRKTTYQQQTPQVQPQPQPKFKQQRQQQPKNEDEQLPPDWMALQDPSSGMTYYANRTTGETTWEKPAPVQPAPQPVQQSPYATGSGFHNQQQPNIQQQTHSSTQQQSQQPTAKQSSPGANGNTHAKLVSKYGDGFVTSASHPELGQQYGNVGTSNPYTGVQRPGTAAAVIAPPKEEASSTENFDSSKLSQLSPELQTISDGLHNLVNAISACELSVSERKQLAEVQKGVAILVKKLLQGQVDGTVLEKVQKLVFSIQNRDYASAGATQTSLVHSDWKEHKDWLKGMKFLIQLGARRMI